MINCRPGLSHHQALVRSFQRIFLGFFGMPALCHERTFGAGSNRQPSQRPLTMVLHGTHWPNDSPTAAATLPQILNAVRGFAIWPAGQLGYRSRISYSDADYWSRDD